MSLSSLTNYFNSLIGKNSKYRGSIQRKMFCNVNQKRLIDFPFDSLFDLIQKHYNQMRESMNEYYSTFYCTLCDAENH
jgi:hypothetical protein